MMQPVIPLNYYDITNAGMELYTTSACMAWNYYNITKAVMKLI